LPVFTRYKIFRIRWRLDNFLNKKSFITGTLDQPSFFTLHSPKVSDLHPFHADPDPGLEIFSDPDPGFEIFANLDPGLNIFKKFVFFYRKK